jgi:2-methylcitrate dehydratase PrpD
MPTAAQRLADFAAALQFDDIPGEVVEAAKLHLLDTLGCALAAQAVGLAGQGRELMADQGGREQSSAIGSSDLLPAASAAFANGMLSHGLDFDDTHSDSMTHVTSVVGPAALAVAESREASGSELVVALVAGSELVTRIGMAVTGQFHARGFHATAVCGVFGAAAAAMRLAGGTPATTASALGIAGSFAGGLFVYLDEGTQTKPIHPAWAAHGGVLAAELASRGAEGPTTVLEGRFGLYHAFVDAQPGTIDLEDQTQDLGRRWETPRIAYKPYPICHFIHGSLGGTASLLDRVDPGAVERIEVSVPQAAVPIVLEPVETKVAPRTDYDAKFSLQFCTAAMLVTGRVDLQTFSEETLRDETILGLARKVDYEVRDYETWPAAFPGGVRIVLTDGRVLEADQPHQLGAPDNPMTREQIVDKFRANAGLGLADGDVAALEEALLELEQVDDLTRSLEPIRRARVSSAAAV